MVFGCALTTAEERGCGVLDTQLTGAQAMGLKPGPIESFLQAARESDSTGVVVLKDGKFVAGFGEKKRVFIYSITKAVTGTAAGRLFTEGKWTNLDAPLEGLLPEFAGDPKGKTTLRQLMSHTSGIQDARDGKGLVLREWNTAKDWLGAAKRQPMQEPPGTVFRYNNQGPALVAAAVERTTGERMDRYLRRTVFAPLCMGETSWLTDRAGHAGGYTGLSISALDLARLGQLILNRGQWGGTRILSEEWVRDSALTASQSVTRNMGLLWFLHWEKEWDMPAVVSHSGDGGQYLMIMPNHGIVAVRLRDRGEGNEREQFGKFAQMVVDAFVKKQQ